MPDYSKAIVYKLCCKDPEVTDIYVGSTCAKYKRKNQHKENTIGQNCRKYNYRVYQFIREHGSWDNWDMLPIEVYPCKSKTELVIRERYWFETLKPTLNSRFPQRTLEEYRDTHKEQKAKIGKEYREKHREKLNAKKGKKYKCECGGIWTAGHGKARHIKTIKHQTWEQQPEPNLIFVD
jgi:hypothetical protein